MNIFTSQRVKLVLVLLISFTAIKFVAPQIFLADSPKINPMFITNLKKTPSYIASIPKVIGQYINFGNKTASINQVAVKSPPSGLIFNSISKNVSAAEDKKNDKVYLKIQPGTAYSVEEIEVDGVKKKVLKIYKE
ncbi:hypothetical protein HZA76_00605 [Candidatus Roizmanbacteria bacterium]|nr:hypothetical protein [Candidatus Roizmanbacteria bacterium]